MCQITGLGFLRPPKLHPDSLGGEASWQEQQLHFPAESERDRHRQGASDHYASLLDFIYLPFIEADFGSPVPP